ncbi:DUF6894 family protein [Microvirga pudoricolor]|uniref:DUF6894 family protein n=1 Tax=Microvirga pudoricolor TaxID=2778729 RepID=UPI00194DC917|nr:hypothetical protein [Microvirga pudoricolor]MBM6593750.1 hypothetical protein [Microvirga pudoricolor]
MPRFYFDVRESTRFVPDREGIDFHTLDQAEHEAARRAAEIGRDRLPKSDAREVVIDVRDQNHQRVLVIKISMEVRRLPLEPTPSKPSEYRDRARSVREVAKWVSSEADRIDLLNRATFLEDQASIEEQKLVDQEPPKPHSV